MTRYGKRRFSFFEIVLFALIFLIGWAALWAFQVVLQVGKVPTTFHNMRGEYIVIADHLQLVADQINGSLFRFAIRKDRQEWERYQRQMEDLRAWLVEQRASATKVKIIMVRPVHLTMDVGWLLDEVERIASLYVVQNTGLPASEASMTTVAEQPPESVATAQAQARELAALANRARARAEAIQIFLGTSQQWFSWLRRLMTASMVTLAAFCVWLAVLVYRRVVAPLRLQLIESHVLIERQQKLAHFGELAAIVAHEIRNPLTAISARLFTLQKSLARGSPEHEDASVIRDEIYRLNRIVKDFLEQARPAEPTLAPTSVRVLLDELQKLLAPEYAKQNITVKCDAVIDADVLADAQQVKQVLINLVQNAAESIEGEGTITLRSTETQRSLRGRPTPLIVIEVEDTGPGIPPEVQARLFDPFFSTKKGGTGLGLSIAARIIEKHGGALEFQTQRGRGTIFSVALPRLSENV
jgi:signal transduction histidine kinase